MPAGRREKRCCIRGIPFQAANEGLVALGEAISDSIPAALDLMLKLMTNRQLGEEAVGPREQIAPHSDEVVCRIARWPEWVFATPLVQLTHYGIPEVPRC